MSAPSWLQLPWARRLGARDAVRSALAGAQGMGTRGAAQALFDAGGHAVLPPAVQGAVRGAVEREASRWLGKIGLAGERAGAGLFVEGAARAVGAQSVRSATRQIVRALGVSAAAGAVVDGGWALVVAERRVRDGSMTRRQAAFHVAREAGTGAAAVAVGAAASTALVVLTGGVAAPAVFAVGAVAAFGAKAGLSAWSARSAGAIRARLARPK